MLKISKKVEYALMALKLMMINESQKVTFSTREISDHFHIPFDTLAKVMQVLTNVEILKSAQGVKGGYYLNKTLKTISYYDLTILLEGETFGDYCNGPKSVCEQFSYCNIFNPLHRLNELTINYFKTISIEELLLGNFNSDENKENLEQQHEI